MQNTSSNDITDGPTCPACNGTRFLRRFAVDGHPLLRCERCALEMLHPQPSDETLAAIYNQDYQLAAGNAAETDALDAMKELTAGLYLDALGALPLPDRARLLEVGCGWGHFIGMAARAGYDACGVELSPWAAKQAAARAPSARIINATIEEAGLAPATFDVCVMIDLIEHVRDPLGFLRTVGDLLKPGGQVFIVTPSTDSLSARLMGRRWMEYKTEHLYAFSRDGMRRLLARCGFADAEFRPGRKALNFNFIQAYLERFTVPGLTPLVRALRAVTPDRLAFRQVVIPAGGMIATARKRD